MNRLLWNLLATVSLLFLAVACGSSNRVDTAALQQSFQNAAPEIKSEADKAVAAIKAGDFAAATTALKNVVRPKGLTPDQQSAVSQAVTQMQMIASQNPEKYPTEVYRAIGEVMPLMDGGTPTPVPGPLPARP